MGRSTHGDSATGNPRRGASLHEIIDAASADIGRVRGSAWESLGKDGFEPHHYPIPGRGIVRPVIVPLRPRALALNLGDSS